MEKVGRNDPCPCGSGKKYKNCHYGKEMKKTYTADGKRKFKATVLTSSDKSQSVFQGNQQQPRKFEAKPLDVMKFRKSKDDFRVSEGASGGEKLPFKLPDHEKLEKPTVEHEEVGKLPEEFKKVHEDFRVKKEEE